MSQGKALKSSSLGQKRFICKWMADITPTGKNIQEWKMRLEGQCPFCYKSQEDRDHILRCSNTGSINIWNQAIKEYQEKLQ